MKTGEWQEFRKENETEDKSCSSEFDYRRADYFESCDVDFSGIFKRLLCLLSSSGFTDMIDGTIARKLGTESEFGSKFDTVADIVFVAAYNIFC